MYQEPPNPLPPVCIYTFTLVFTFLACLLIHPLTCSRAVMVSGASQNLTMGPPEFLGWREAIFGQRTSKIGRKNVENRKLFDEISTFFLLILSFVVKFVVSWRRWRLSGFGVNLVLFGNFIRTLFHVFRELSQRSFI